MSVAGAELSDATIKREENTMAVYLVDFENVTSAGISGVQKLTKEDKVYIFYTANAANMSFAAHLNLLSSPAEIIYYNVSSGGKNALDFQLSSFLGYLICQGKEKQFYIISGDRGYEHVRSFWEVSGLADGVTISGAPTVNKTLMLERPVFTAQIKQQEDISAEEKIPPSLPEENAVPAEEIPAEEVPETAEKKPAPKKRGRKKKSQQELSEELPASLKTVLAKAEVTDEKQSEQILDLLKKSAGKQQFYRGILKIFGMERGVEVYKAVRPEYTNLTKLVRK